MNNPNRTQKCKIVRQEYLAHLLYILLYIMKRKLYHLE
jgi:hypothetical protein